MRSEACQLCRQFLGGAWKQVSSNEIILKKINGGLTNLLYYCALPENKRADFNEPEKVLLRLYGAIHKDGNKDALLTENIIFALLSERRLGPKLYGFFNGGRLEEYIPVPALKRTALNDPVISVLIAEKLAQVHNLHVPINKEPLWMYDSCVRWLHSIQELTSKQPESDEKASKVNKLRSFNLESELTWLWDILERTGSDVVFSHNDLQEGNLLYNAEASSASEKMIFIDFELCCYNYRAFDFANHFNEWTWGYNVKTAPYFEYYPGDYPTKKQQLKFIRTYYRSIPKTLNGSICVQPDEDSDPTDEEEKFLFEIRIFSLASHFYYTLWSFINAQISKITFGYWDYGESRLGAYYNEKAKLLEDPRFENFNSKNRL